MLLMFFIVKNFFFKTNARVREAGVSFFKTVLKPSSFDRAAYYHTLPGRAFMSGTEKNQVALKKAPCDAMSDEILRLEQQVVDCLAIANARDRQLRALTLKMTEAEERERRRISRILHGDLQQILFGARLQLYSAIKNGHSVTALKNIDRILEEAISISRNLSHRFNPPELHQINLASAFEWLINDYQKRFGLTTRLEPDVPDIHDPSMKVFIFRAAEELLFNVVKHSGVENAEIFFAIPDSNMVLTVRDQGRGCCPDNMDSAVPKEGMGLLHLRERVRALGGDLLVKSSPGDGCCCTLRVPVSF